VRVIKQSVPANIKLLMVDSTDHVTGKTGLTLTITAAKDNAAFASITPTVTERSYGWYELALTAAHTDTLGDLALHASATGADPSDRLLVVEAATLTDVDSETDAIVTALGTPVTSIAADIASRASQASVTAIPVNPLLITDIRLNNLDATISSRNASTPPTTAEINATLTAAHGSGSWQTGTGGGGGGSGTGDTAVDHNFGGTDNLRYESSPGVGIDNGSVIAYVKSAYDAGDLSAPVAATVTRSDGRWQNPLMLDAGVTYALMFYKQGVYSATTVEITP